MSAFEWFRNTCSSKVGDLVKDKPPIISVHYKTTIGDTLTILQEKNVTSVGVYGDVGHWLGNPQIVCAGKQYIGLISIVDILAYIWNCEPSANCMSYDISDVIGSTSESSTVRIENVDRALFFAMEQFCRGAHTFIRMHMFFISLAFIFNRNTPCILHIFCS